MNLDQILKDKFKKEAFREGQRPIIENALAETNVFATIPTGGGKSLCYQFLAGLQSGQVMVISPLVALIDDQHKEAQNLGLNSLKIHSNLSSKDKKEFYNNLGQADILFLTPERLIQPEFWTRTLEHLKVKYLVIDEAHCMSQWGSDFRPDYTRIPDFIDQLKQPTVLAMTATATSKVKEDVLSRLKEKSEKPWFFHSAPLERPNIKLQIFESFGFEEKLQRIAYQLKSIEGSKIVYFALIQNLEKASEELVRLGFQHTKYHGQLPPYVKLKNQRSFFTDERSLILATPAFGLGVNKPDIRMVLHFEMPQSIEAYYQEVGRAGRDGLKAVAELMYDKDDAEIHLDFLKWNHPEPGFITSIYNLILDYPQRYKQEGADFLREKLNFYNRRDFRVETALNLLKRWDVLLEKKGASPTLSDRSLLNDIPDIDEELYAQRKRSAQIRLLDLIQLLEKFKANSMGLQEAIIEYFKS